MYFRKIKLKEEMLHRPEQLLTEDLNTYCNVSKRHTDGLLIGESQLES